VEGDGDENSFCVAACEAVLDSGVEIPYSAKTAAAEADTDEGGVTDDGGATTELPTAPPPLEVELIPNDEPNPKVSPKGLLVPNPVIGAVCGILEVVEDVTAEVVDKEFPLPPPPTSPIKPPSLPSRSRCFSWTCLPMFFSVSS
jgi:hypothetical protein